MQKLDIDVGNLTTVNTSLKLEIEHLEAKNHELEVRETEMKHTYTKLNTRLEILRESSAN
jgi:FtsZ-binding cell division protein ZapB